MLRVLLIGVHDKGLGQPFAPSTLSGRRLRRMLDGLALEYRLADMMSPVAIVPSDSDLERLHTLALSCDRVVLLGKMVQAALSRHFPDAVALPHPASRRKQDLELLQSGLADLSG